MPRPIKPDDKSIMEDQICEVWEKTSKEDREFIAQAWSMNYMFDISDFVKHTGLPPIALKVASLIDTEHPLLVSPGRGVIYSAFGCAVVVMAVEIANVRVGTPQCLEILAKVLPKPSLVRRPGAKAKPAKVRSSKKVAAVVPASP